MQGRFNTVRKPYGFLTYNLSRVFPTYQYSQYLSRLPKTHSSSNFSKLLWFSGVLATSYYLNRSNSPASCIEAPLQMIIEPHNRRQKQKQFLAQSKEKVENLVTFFVEKEVISNIHHLNPAGTDQPFSKSSNVDYSKRLISVNEEVSVFVTNSPKSELIAIPSAVLKIFEEGLELAYFKASKRQWKDWASKKILDLEKISVAKTESKTVEKGIITKIKSAFGFSQQNPKDNTSQSTSQVEQIASGSKKPLEECAESMNKMIVGYLKEHLDEFVKVTKKIVKDKPENGGQGKKKMNLI